jgi:hypothetical protein
MSVYGIEKMKTKIPIGSQGGNGADFRAGGPVQNGRDWLSLQNSCAGIGIGGGVSLTVKNRGQRRLRTDNRDWANGTGPVQRQCGRGFRDNWRNSSAAISRLAFAEGGSGVDGRRRQM